MYFTLIYQDKYSYLCAPDAIDHHVFHGLRMIEFLDT